MPSFQHAGRTARGRAVVAGLAAFVILVACSKDKSIDQPAKLTPLVNPSLKVRRIWNASVDDKKAIALRLGLGVSVADNRVYAAGHRGDLVALDLGTGRVVWRIHTRAPLSGGTATGNGLVVVGASDGQLFAFDAANGQSRWKSRVNGEVVAPAAISEHLIALRTVDGKLHALNAADGHELWSQEQAVPRLSLRGTARPVIVGDVVLSGFDNGKVLAVNANDGSVQWEATVTPPHGRTELERLADIDSAVTVSGQDVYAVGFQGRVAMLALDTGQIWWSHESSSYSGLTLDDDAVYVSTSDGEIVALKARTGTDIWRQTALLHRGLSPVAVMDNAIVTADFQGYVHWLDKTSGALIARVQAGKVRVSTAPVVAGNTVVVINDRGQIDAYRVTPEVAPAKRSKNATPTKAAAPAPAAAVAPAEGKAAETPAATSAAPPATPAETPAAPPTAPPATTSPATPAETPAAPPPATAPESK
ncbi:MAG TPA: outer membrane protein assembly factor BamB [Stellaceae bacterium]|nr:outer membrane protein assembly factor BamB [Stellaceae bacterium]